VKRPFISLGLFGAIVVAILIVSHFYEHALFSTVSPHQQYRVEITQSRQFPSDERAVFLSAYRNGDKVVYHKLLYTGDLLDNDFRNLYSNPRFRSESIYELGNVTNDGSIAETGDLTVSNETLREISFLLIETGWYKLIVLSLEPGGTLHLNLQYNGTLSCQGQFADSRQRFADAVAIVQRTEAKGGRWLSITVRGNTAKIESRQPGLQPAKCCASDRPDPEHEWLY